MAHVHWSTGLIKGCIQGGAMFYLYYVECPVFSMKGGLQARNGGRGSRVL